MENTSLIKIVILCEHIMSVFIRKSIQYQTFADMSRVAISQLFVRLRSKPRLNVHRSRVVTVWFANPVRTPNARTVRAFGVRTMFENRTVATLVLARYFDLSPFS